MSDTVVVTLILAVAVVSLVVFLSLFFGSRIRKLEADVSKGRISIELSAEEKEAAVLNLKKAEESKAAEYATADSQSSARLAKVRGVISALQKRIRKRILWVDDEPENNRNERETFLPLGIDVVQVRTNREAEGELDQFPYDLVITDIGRSGQSEDGIQLIRAISHRDPSIPIITYTSSKGVQFKRTEVLRSGARGITASPSELLELVLANLAKSSPEVGNAGGA